MTPPAVSSDFYMALEAVSAPTLLHNAKQILFANAAMQRLLGYEQHVLLQMKPHGWAAEEFADELQRYGGRCLAEDGEMPAMEIEAQTGSLRARKKPTPIMRMSETELRTLSPV